LGHQGEESIALGLRTAPVRLKEDDVYVLLGRSDSDPAEISRGHVVAYLEAESVAVEGQRVIRIVDRDECCRESKWHTTIVKIASPEPLLRSCSFAATP
jgi:hypothetical protein